MGFTALDLDHLPDLPPRTELIDGGLIPFGPQPRFRDRERKPELYARAGIRHYWRIENVDDRPVVYVDELDPAASTYFCTGIHHGRLRLDVPFPINIDLETIQDQ